jgi:hypothetical protein
MRVAYHPFVQPDVTKILRHYDGISPRLGDEFWAELMRLVELVAANPQRFHLAARGLRRANMRRFPWSAGNRERQQAARSPYASRGWESKP